MDYTVLARRFRPQSFGEVVGQEMIAQALRNAIAAGRVAHAYLFTGARGVGKTSTARILAKSLNCPNVKNGDPCNECEICKGISAGNDVDVIEIDGASNRGIDEIRALRANVSVRSMRSRFKIYIIDEVHMLTDFAFNALLKTLEEPPPNVKFIFCTTDPQKLPDTILSRCQRFDFGTIATDSIRQRLAEIAEAEGVKVEAGAVDLVARRAAGSMRDSQSLFDQLLAFGGETISAADVHRLLGTAPDDRLIGLMTALAERRREMALRLFHTALQSGVQLSEFTDQILGCLRDLMVLSAGAANADLLSVAEDHRPALATLAGSWGLQTILAALQILADAKGRMKGVTYGRVLAEMALVRIATLDQLDAIVESLAVLKSGKGPALPTQGAVGSGRPALTGTGHPAAAVSTSDPVKKNESALTDVISEEVARDERITLIPWEPGRESEIWSQAVSLLTDMTKSQAQKASRTAISGPNQLVLSFPKSYHLSKQYFERSADQVNRLEKAVERVVGRPVRITLELDETAPGPAVSSEVRNDANRAAADESDNDPLVKRAMEVFGARKVRSEPVTASNRE